MYNMDYISNGNTQLRSSVRCFDRAKSYFFQSIKFFGALVLID